MSDNSFRLHANSEGYCQSLHPDLCGNNQRCFSLFSCSTYALIIQSNRKVTQPIPDTCSICQKINYIDIRKQKNNVILSVGNVHRVQRCMHSLVSSCLMQPGEEFLFHGNGSPDEILSICLAQKNREMYP
jgi:hypothetical protein